jgi:hypothetical protein
MNLGFDDHHALTSGEEFLSGSSGFFGRFHGFTAGNGCPVLGEELLRLIFVDIH